MIQHILFLKNLRIALEDIEKEGEFSIWRSFSFKLGGGAPPRPQPLLQARSS
jgi:hypothetical protein